MIRRSKFLAAIILLSLFSNAYCQWVRANSANRGAVNSLSIFGQRLIAGTNNSGVFISNDSVTIWDKINVGLSSLIVNSIVYVGSNLYAATATGVSHSSDSGQHWIQGNTGLPKLFVKSITSIGNNIFAGLDGAIYLSKDEGLTWNEADFGLPTNLGLAYLSSQRQILFASFGSEGSYTSTNNGVSWKQMPAQIGKYSNHRISIRSIAVFDSIFIAGAVGGIYLSTDNGANWKESDSGIVEDGSPGLTGSILFSSIIVKGSALFAIDITTGNLYMSKDTSRTWVIQKRFSSLSSGSLFAKGKSLYFGNSTGDVLVSNDDGVNWKLTNLGVPSSAHFTSIMSLGKKVFAGTNGFGVYASNDNGDNWFSSNTGASETFVNALCPIGKIIYSGTSGGVFQSTDSGNTWTNFSAGLPNSIVVNSLTLAGNDLLLSSRDSGVYVSKIPGGTWKPMNAGLTSLKTNSLTSIGSTLIVGTDGDGIFRNANNGSGWSKSDPIPSMLYVTSLGLIGGDVYATTKSLFGNGSIFISPDSGLVWAERGILLKNAPQSVTSSATPITGIVEYGFNIFCGTSLGLFSSNDKGKNWIAVDTSIFGVTSVVGKNDQSLFAYSGGSVWRLTTPSPTQVGNKRSTIKINGEDIKLRINGNVGISYNITSPGIVQLVLVSVSGRKATSLVNGFQNSGEHIVGIPKKRSPGLYICRLIIGDNQYSKPVLIN